MHINDSRRIYKRSLLLRASTNVWYSNLLRAALIYARDSLSYTTHNAHAVRSALSAFILYTLVFRRWPPIKHTHNNTHARTLTQRVLSSSIIILLINLIYARTIKNPLDFIYVNARAAPSAAAPSVCARLLRQRYVWFFTARRSIHKFHFIPYSLVYSLWCLSILKYDARITQRCRAIYHKQNAAPPLDYYAR